MESFDAACSFLSVSDRDDLAKLLEFCQYEAWVTDDDYAGQLSKLIVYGPPSIIEALECLQLIDQERMLEAVTAMDISLHGRSTHGCSVQFVVDEMDIPPQADLLAMAICQREVLIDVATGESRIQAVDDYYKGRRKRMAILYSHLGFDDPNPFGSLWDWYSYWREHFSTYVARRGYIREMYAPLISSLLGKQSNPVPLREPTGWERVDRAIEKARTKLQPASHEEDLQQIGLLCREALISLGQAVFDPSVDLCLGEEAPSETDAKGLIDAFLSRTAGGTSGEATRRYVKAAWSLAVELQHKRTADFRHAALCLEACSSVANAVTILSGHRDAVSQ